MKNNGGKQKYASFAGNHKKSGQLWIENMKRITAFVGC